MATKKKIKKAPKNKPGKAAKKSGKKKLKKLAAKGNASKRVAVPKKPLVLKPPVKPVAKPAAKSSVAKAAAKNRRTGSSRGKREVTDSVDFEPVGLGARSGGQ